MTMSRPARVWLFNPDTVGLCEFRPPCRVSEVDMPWDIRAGMEFTMMEKSVRAEFSAAGRSFPPYGAGNNHNTWYAATMVDATRCGDPLRGPGWQRADHGFWSDIMPAPGQKFFPEGRRD